MSVTLEVGVDIPPAAFRAVLEGVCQTINGALRSMEGNVRSALREDIHRLITESPEGISLVGGKLRGRLGLKNGAAALAALAESVWGALSYSLDEPLRVVGEAVRGSLSISLLREDFQEALSIREAEFTSEGGYTIPWLEWMLFEGGRSVILGYHFVGGNRVGSRTGSGVMARGGLFSIPAEFAGSPKDNFLTRALTEIAPICQKVVEEELGRRVG